GGHDREGRLRPAAGRRRVRGETREEERAAVGAVEPERPSLSACGDPFEEPIRRDDTTAGLEGFSERRPLAQRLRAGVDVPGRVAPARPAVYQPPGCEDGVALFALLAGDPVLLHRRDVPPRPVMLLD